MQDHEAETFISEVRALCKRYPSLDEDTAALALAEQARAMDGWDLDLKSWSRGGYVVYETANLKWVARHKGSGVFIESKSTGSSSHQDPTILQALAAANAAMKAGQA
jgi:hypothetical protein